MSVYYNDNEEYCCKVLRARIADGSLPDGVVDSRSISDVPANELKQYKQIHLFCGIGGFPLALEWINFGRDRSIITGGFPCQDISTAGKGAGLEGERSGLWWETLAAISVVRPEILCLENVSALLARGLDVVLGSLAPLGYRVQWHCVPAAYVGAPHRHDRIWIVGVREDMADTEGKRMEGNRPAGKQKPQIPAGEKISGRHSSRGEPENWGAECRLGIHPDGLQPGLDDCGGWECGVPRVAKGQKDRAKRLKALGNAIVPQCAAFVLKHVLDTKEVDSHDSDTTNT